MSETKVFLACMIAAVYLLSGGLTVWCALDRERVPDTPVWATLLTVVALMVAWPIFVLSSTPRELSKHKPEPK